MPPASTCSLLSETKRSWSARNGSKRDVRGRRHQPQPRPDDEGALPLTSQRHLEQLTLARLRAGDEPAVTRHHFQLDGLIDERSEALAPDGLAADAEKTADRQHRAIRHHRQRESCGEGLTDERGQGRPRLDVDRAIRNAANVGEGPAVDDDAAVDQRLAISGMSAAAHHHRKTMAIGVLDNADDVVDRSGAEDGTRPAPHDTALIRGRDIEHRVGVRERSVECRQIRQRRLWAEELSRRRQAPDSAQRGPRPHGMLEKAAAVNAGHRTGPLRFFRILTPRLGWPCGGRMATITMLAARITALAIQGFIA
jgi:hypothetical protein